MHIFWRFRGFQQLKVIIQLKKETNTILGPTKYVRSKQLILKTTEISDPEYADTPLFQRKLHARSNALFLKFLRENYCIICGKDNFKSGD